MFVGKRNEEPSPGLPEKALCKSRRYFLYVQARKLIRDVWGFRAVPEAPEKFMDSENVKVRLVVSKPLPDREAWDIASTMAVEREIGSDDHQEVLIVVDGAVQPDALSRNLHPESKVRVIEAQALANSDLDALPEVVDWESVCLEEDLGGPNEMAKVRSSAPEVQLLRVRKGSVLAYRPTPEIRGVAPSGQCSDWEARLVVL